MAEPPSSPKPDPGNGDLRGLAMLSTAVAEMVVAVAFGLWLDRKFGTEPWIAMACAVVGITGGVAHLIYISRRSARGGKPSGAGKDS